MSEDIVDFKERILVIALNCLDDLQDRMTSVEGTYGDLLPEFFMLDMEISEYIWPIICLDSLGRIPTEMPNLEEMTDDGEKVEHTSFTKIMTEMSELLVNSFTEMWDDEEPDRIIPFEESGKFVSNIEWANLVIKSQMC